LSSVNAVIYHNGVVEYLPPTKLKSTCQIQIEQFPFDEQNCTLEFGTWTYDESLINLIPLGDEAQLDAYIENNEWNLLSNLLI
jgi:nicotinic acetylcholine receptor, invertebrate